MLHNEFEALIGRTATENEYVIANAMYEACGHDIDKETFCADYVKHQDSIILKGIWGAYNSERDARGVAVDAANEYKADAAKLRNEIGAFLVERAEHFHSGTLRDKAIELLGLRTYLKTKIEKGDNLWRRDFMALIGEINGGMQNILEALGEQPEE